MEHYTSEYISEATVDDIVDLLYVMFDNPNNHEDGEKIALKWIFSYNHKLLAKPIDLISQNKVQEVYDYLYHSAYTE